MFNEIVNITSIIITIIAIFFLRNSIQNNNVFQVEKDKKLYELKQKYNIQVEKLVTLKKERNRLKSYYSSLKENMNRSINALESIRKNIVMKCKKRMKEDSINLQTQLKKDTLKIFQNHLLKKLKTDSRLLDLYQNIDLDNIFSK